MTYMQWSCLHWFPEGCIRLNHVVLENPGYIMTGPLLAWSPSTTKLPGLKFRPGSLEGVKGHVGNDDLLRCPASGLHLVRVDDEVGLHVRTS